MLFSLPVVLTTLLSLAAVVVATPANIDRLYGIEPRDTGHKCDSHLTPEVVSKAEAAFASLLVNRETVASGVFAIPVNFHVIYASEAISDGYLSDSQIQSQIDVLNKDYTGTSLSFELKNVTRTLNAGWFNDVGRDTPEQTAMKSALRQGTASTLNIYSVGFSSSQGLIGYSTFPFEYESNPTDDGVVIRYSSLPGGSSTDHNLGRTSTHEIGHWLGLYHTFRGGCDGDGDFVDDTPAEAFPSYGCPTDPPDTCSSAGLDPVHNYMDYSYDSCVNNFTPGQIARLHSQNSAYRGINV